MNNPTKRNSKILKSLRDNKNALESKRTRTSMLLATRITKGTKDKNWSKTYFAEQIGKSHLSFLSGLVELIILRPIL